MTDIKYVNQNVKPLNTKRNEKGNLEISNVDLVELAKKYGEEQSKNFVNGILASIIKEG